MYTSDFTVVVAEDDAILRYCTVRLLKRQGYRVFEACDGIEALDLIEQRESKVDLLVTNYDMPRMNGAELLQKLKGKPTKPIVLLISGSDHGVTPTDDLEVLPKPFNEATLAVKVRDLLRRRYGRTQQGRDWHPV